MFVNMFTLQTLVIYTTDVTEWRSPEPKLSCTVWLWPETWPPSERRRRRSGPPLRSLCRRKLLLRERPTLRMCLQWSSCLSHQHHPVGQKRGKMSKSLFFFFFDEINSFVYDNHLRSSNDEATARLEVVDGLIVQIFSRNHGVDHLIESMHH